MPYFTGIPPHVRILSEIEGICRGKEDLRDDMVLKMIEYLIGYIHWVCVFNLNKIKDCL